MADEITSPTFRMWLRADGIVQLVWQRGVPVGVEDCVAAGDAMDALAAGHEHPLMVDTLAGGHVSQGQPFAQRDHRSVGGPQRQISVLIDQLRQPREIGGEEVDGLQLACGQRPQKHRLSAGTGLTCEQIADLSDNGNRHSNGRRAR